MQTFLPFPDFRASAATLDNKRLGKQRVENLQIMGTLLDPARGWQNHPAVKMWRGYEYGLFRYQIHICAEWKSRGFNDTCRDKTLDLWFGGGAPGLALPPWFGQEEFHRSHQSNLIRKDPDHYSPHFPGVPGDLPYVWPV